jgi:hypothetical protein
MNTKPTITQHPESIDVKLSEADTHLANRILDKLCAGETICCLDFPEIEEARFDAMMEWLSQSIENKSIQ